MMVVDQKKLDEARSSVATAIVMLRAALNCLIQVARSLGMDAELDERKEVNNGA